MKWAGHNPAPATVQTSRLQAHSAVLQSVNSYQQLWGKISMQTKGWRQVKNEDPMRISPETLQNAAISAFARHHAAVAARP